MSRCSALSVIIDNDISKSGFCFHEDLSKIWNISVFFVFYDEQNQIQSSIEMILWPLIIGLRHITETKTGQSRLVFSQPLPVIKIDEIFIP